MRGRLIQDRRPLVLRPGASVRTGVQDRLCYPLDIGDVTDVAPRGSLAEREGAVAEQTPAEAVAHARAVHACEWHRLPGPPNGAARGDDEDAPCGEGQQGAVPLPYRAGEAHDGARGERHGEEVECE